MIRTVLSWWRALWTPRVAIEVPSSAVLTPLPAPGPMKISRRALEAAMAQPEGKDRADALRRLFPVPGPPQWIPEAAREELILAMDAVVDQSYGYAATGYFGEGIGFLGYPYLAELTQRPEYRVISMIRAQEMTRKWVELTYTGDQKKAGDKLRKLTESLQHHKIQDLFRRVTEHDGFYGRGTIYIDTGATDKPAELFTPLIVNKNKISKGQKVRFKTIEALWTYPGVFNGIDPLKSDFYKPSHWWVQGKTVHESRLLIFVSREMPDLLKAAYMFGGLSLSQMAKPYVDNWLRTRQSVSDLIANFATKILKTDLSSILNNGNGQDLFARLDMFNLLQGNRGTFALNNGSAGGQAEEFVVASVPLGTLDKLQAQSQEQMCSVSQTPVVKLLGLTPTGLNTSTDGEIRSYYDMVHALQEHLYRTPLEKVVDVLQLVEFGEIDPSISFKFVPLWALDEVALSAVRKSDTDSDIELIDAGVISPEEVRSKITADKNSPYAGLDPDELPEPPEESEGAKILPDATKNIESQKELRNGV